MSVHGGYYDPAESVQALHAHTSEGKVFATTIQRDDKPTKGYSLPSNTDLVTKEGTADFFNKIPKDPYIHLQGDVIADAPGGNSRNVHDLTAERESRAITDKIQANTGVAEQTTISNFTPSAARGYASLKNLNSSATVSQGHHSAATSPRGNQPAEQRQTQTQQSAARRVISPTGPA